MDDLGRKWAIQNGIPVKMFPAKWDEHGKKAGYLRNVEMADNADALIALWDGGSQGTNLRVPDPVNRVCADANLFKEWRVMNHTYDASGGIGRRNQA